MKKNISLFTFFLLVTILVSSCSKDSDTITTTPTNGNRNPNMPSNPHPTNGQVNVSGFVTVTFTGGDPDGSDTVRYDVKAGTSSPPSTLVASNTLNAAADIGVGATNTLIYWQVVAKDNHGGVTTGPIWNYKTAP